MKPFLKFLAPALALLILSGCATKPAVPFDYINYKASDPKSILVTTYALCGFANFASIGIQLGGIGALAPERRADLARLGVLALLGGFLATLINAAVAGLLM